MRYITYYWRDKAGEIYNATETSLSLVELTERFPLPEGHWYDAHPPLEVLKRYRYWDERP